MTLFGIKNKNYKNVCLPSGMFETSIKMWLFNTVLILHIPSQLLKLHTDDDDFIKPSICTCKSPKSPE